MDRQTEKGTYCPNCGWIQNVCQCNNECPKNTGEDMDKPSDSEVKELWEWCGISRNDSNIMWARGYPCYDSLDDLFKYAVPLLDDWNMGKHETLGCWATAHIDGRKLGTGINKKPELALFWAIWEVIHE